MKYKILIVFNVFFFSINAQVTKRVDITGKLNVINAIGDTSMYIGLNAGQSDDQTDNENTFIGINCGVKNISGNDNTFLGIESGYFNTLGNDNTFFGRLSGWKNTIGSSNTFLGRSAGRENVDGIDNTFVGRSAGLNNLSGLDNTFIGRSAGTVNTNGRDNTFIGKAAGQGNTSADDNTFVGRFSGTRHRLGNNNTFIGESSGVTDSLGSHNTIIGANADVLGFSQINSVAIGYLAKSTTNNQVVIGNTSTTQIGGYSNWTNLSDGRYKKNIKQNVPGLDFILKLKPVTYNLDNDKINNYLYKSSNIGLKMNESTMTGFIAQDVAQAASDVNYDFSGVVIPENQEEQYKLKYAEFVVPLTKAVQEQQIIIQSLIAEVATLKQKINETKN